jgi:hypothetical protein
LIGRPDDRVGDQCGGGERGPGRAPATCERVPDPARGGDHDRGGHQAHQPGRLEAAEVVGQLVEEQQQWRPVDEQRAVEVRPALVPVLRDDQQPGLVRERQPVQERQPQQQREADSQGDDARGRADAGQQSTQHPSCQPPDQPHAPTVRRVPMLGR